MQEIEAEEILFKFEPRIYMIFTDKNVLSK